MDLTCHSEIGKIKTVFLKHAQQAFISDAHIGLHWKQLNYTGKPDFNMALKEYESFLSAFKEFGTEIHYFPEDPTVNMDSVYCRDAAIATDQGMIICNMGKAARKNEPAVEQKSFVENGFKILGTIQEPGTLEGGDVAWLDKHTLAVGQTYRSNEAGISQLASMLEPMGVNIITVPLPHYKGPSDVFHLMSVFSPVDIDLAVVYSPLMPIVFRNLLLQRGYQLVEVPEDEFDSMGCNVLALAPRVCMIAAGNNQTKLSLENAGCKVIEYKGEEISVKGGGGPTCLTRPLYRYV